MHTVPVLSGLSAVAIGYVDYVHSETCWIIVFLVGLGFVYWVQDFSIPSCVAAYTSMRALIRVANSYIISSSDHPCV